MTRYPWWLVQRLSERVEQCRADEAHADLDAVLGIIAAARGGGLTLRKLRCAQVISFCLRGAHRGGAHSGELLAEHLVALERLARQRSWPATTRLLHDYVARLVAHLRPPPHRANLQRFIRWMDRDLRRVPDSARGLKHYAYAAGVTVEHLSRSFAAVRGVTFRDHRLRLRVEAAKSLLVRTTLKVSEVGRRVGWHDASHFVATFARETSLTPAVYRSRHRLR